MVMIFKIKYIIFYLLVLTALIKTLFILYLFSTNKYSIIILPYLCSSVFKTNISSSSSNVILFSNMTNQYLYSIKTGDIERNQKKENALLYGLEMQEKYYILKNEIHHLNERTCLLTAKLLQSFSVNTIIDIMDIGIDINKYIILENNPPKDLLDYFSQYGDIGNN